MAKEKQGSPLVSIITPSYNQAGYISRTIKSVRMQDYPNIEHIVVDGKSNDGTVGILKKCGWLRWISEKDSGQTNAINKGLRMAKGEIIGWINSDDTYCQGAVSTAVKFLNEHSEIDIVCTRVNVIDENDKKTGEHFIFPHHPFIQLNIANCIPSQGIFFRKRLLEEVGYFDEKLNYVMDYEFWVRVGRKRKIAMIPRVYANFRIVKGTKTFENYDKFFDEVLEVNRKYGGIPYFWMATRQFRRLLVRFGLLQLVRGVKNNLFRLLKH